MMKLCMYLIFPWTQLLTPVLGSNSNMITYKEITVPVQAFTEQFRRPTTSITVCGAMCKNAIGCNSFHLPDMNCIMGDFKEVLNGVKKMELWVEQFRVTATRTTDIMTPNTAITTLTTAITIPTAAITIPTTAITSQITAITTLTTAIITPTTAITTLTTAITTLSTAITTSIIAIITPITAITTPTTAITTQTIVLTTSTIPTTAIAGCQVLCGGHYAASCSECGPNVSFCNEDCKWDGLKCTEDGILGLHLGEGMQFKSGGKLATLVAIVRSVTDYSVCCKMCKDKDPSTEVFNYFMGRKKCFCHKIVQGKLKATNQSDVTSGYCVKTDTSKKVVWLDSSGKIDIDVGEARFNSQFNCCPVVTYHHKGAIRGIYVRISPIPNGFNAYKLFTSTWSNKNNLLNKDFKMYSSMEDAKAKNGAWIYCNYKEDEAARLVNAGFPIHCGPTGPIKDHRFFYLPDTQWPEKEQEEGLEIYNGDCSAII